MSRIAGSETEVPAVRTTEEEEIVDLKKYFGEAYEEPLKEKRSVTLLKGFWGALLGALPGNNCGGCGYAGCGTSLLYLYLYPGQLYAGG